MGVARRKTDFEIRDKSTTERYLLLFIQLIITHSYNADGVLGFWGFGVFIGSKRRTERDRSA